MFMYIGVYTVIKRFLLLIKDNINEWWKKMPKISFQLQVTELKDEQYLDMKETVPVPTKDHYRSGTVDSYEELIPLLMKWLEEKMDNTKQKDTETTAFEVVKEIGDNMVCPKCNCPELLVSLSQHVFFEVQVNTKKQTAKEIVAPYFDNPKEDVHVITIDCTNPKCKNNLF